jgi:L-cysteate sulfo-lyase
VAPELAATVTRARLEDFRADGRRPYVIPTGGSNALGALGYARCALELLEQSRALGFDLTDVVHASSSAGTQAGLLAGFAGLLAEARTRPAVHGINVYEQDPARLEANVLAMARALLAQYGPDPLRGASDAAVDPAAVRVDPRHLGADYGIPTRATIEAIRLLARTEGVLMDPVYSGKAFAGLVERVRGGEFDHASDVVFVHTGGTVTLPVYEQAFGADAR